MFLCLCVRSIENRNRNRKEFLVSLWVFIIFFSFENKFISSHFDHHDLRPDVADGAAGIEAEAGVCGNAVALGFLVTERETTMLSQRKYVVIKLKDMQKLYMHNTGNRRVTR